MMKLLHPKQVFVVRSYTREAIAHDLNIVMDEMLGATPEPFLPDDARLTNEVCERFVDGLNEAGDGNFDAEAEFMYNFVESLCKS